MPVTINGSTGISGVDGSTGTPAIIGSDADTGLVFSAGQVQASLNGTAANVALVSGTAKASTSGTSIDFSPADNTGIPSWVKRVTVMFDGVSQTGTSPYLIQIGDSGGIENTGYLSYSARFGAAAVAGGSVETTGFKLNDPNLATEVISGSIIISTLGSNIWVAQGCAASTSNGMFMGGSKTLSATLDRLRITTISGLPTFDAGSINIMWE